jgi:hypothetical protein
MIVGQQQFYAGFRSVWVKPSSPRPLAGTYFLVALPNNLLKVITFLKASREGTMPRISRRALAAIIAVSTLMPGAACAADALKEIRIDWATCNPVSMVLKQKGLLEKEFARDGISVWVQSAGSNKARIPQRRLDRFRIDRRLDGAGRKDQRTLSTSWAI